MRENIKKINMNIYIYNIIMEHRHEHRHTDLCKRFITDVLYLKSRKFWWSPEQHPELREWN